MPVQKNILVFETMTQVDALSFRSAPVQAGIVERMIQQDAFSSYINAGSFREQMQQIDLLQFVLAGGTGQLGIYIAQDMFMQDHFNNPNVLITQGGRETVVLPTDANARLTQAGRDVVLFPVGSTHAFITQAGREVIVATPEAFLTDVDYFMVISETLQMQESLLINETGKYFLLINEHLTPGITDQDTNLNVKVKKNQGIKATNYVTGDTSLNHWQEAIFMFPFNAVLSVADQMTTLSESLAKTLAISVLLTQSAADQISMSDAAPTFLMTMQETFIQTMNQWQEFILGQPLVQISALFAEVMQDQDQESISGFQPYFLPFVDSLTMTEQWGAGYGNLLSDAGGLNDSVLLVGFYGLSFTETLSINESLIAGYGLITNDDNETNWNDFFHGLLINAGELFTETINFFAESLLIGFGILIGDQDTTWLDNILMMTEDDLMVIEGLTMSDTMTTGGGMQLSDAITIVEAMLLGIGQQLAEQMLMADSEQNTVGSPIIIVDSFTITDSILSGMGLLTSEQLSWLDEVDLFSAYNVGLFDQDISWMEFVRTISAIAIGTYFTFFVVTASNVSVSKRVVLQNFTTYLVQA